MCPMCGLTIRLWLLKYNGFISQKMLTPLSFSSVLSFSVYPSKRVTTDKDELEVGVMGKLKRLQNVTLSTQPIASFDWSPDKVSRMHSCYVIISCFLCKKGRKVSNFFLSLDEYSKVSCIIIFFIERPPLREIFCISLFQHEKPFRTLF